MVRLTLNNKFYRIEDVKAAISDFKEVCTARILSNAIEVELEPFEEAPMLGEQFCNYVLGLMRNKSC